MRAQLRASSMIAISSQETFALAGPPDNSWAQLCVADWATYVVMSIIVDTGTEGSAPTFLNYF